MRKTLPVNSFDEEEEIEKMIRELAKDHKPRNNPSPRRTWSPAGASSQIFANANSELRLNEDEEHVPKAGSLNQREKRRYPQLPMTLDSPPDSKNTDRLSSGSRIMEPKASDSKLRIAQNRGLSGGSSISHSHSHESISSLSKSSGHPLAKEKKSMSSVMLFENSSKPPSPSSSSFSLKVKKDVERESLRESTLKNTAPSANYDPSKSFQVLNFGNAGGEPVDALSLGISLIELAAHSLPKYLRVSVDGQFEINYSGWARSEDFATFEELATKLKKVDLNEMQDSTTKLCFWINVYNAMILHIFANYGTATKEKKNLSADCTYQIGGHLLSLNDIFNSILRDSPKKHEEEGMNLPFEPRIHFTLYSGTKSSPYLSIFEPSTAEALLSWTTHLSLEKEVEVSFAKNYVVLPKVFQVFLNDFGTLNEALHWICEFLSEEKGKLVRFVINCEDCEIRFKEYDWTPVPPHFLML